MATPQPKPPGMVGSSGVRLTATPLGGVTSFGASSPWTSPNPSNLASPMATPSLVTAATPGASGGGTVSYEKFAPRSATQMARLNRIAHLTAGPADINPSVTPMPTSTATTITNHMPLAAKSKSQGLLREAMTPPIVVDMGLTPVYLDLWCQDPVRAALLQALSTTDEGIQRWKHTTSLRLALRASINIAEDISQRHAELIRHSGDLSAAADRLQEEEIMLTRHAQEIGMPLQHYDAVDRIGLLVGVLFKGKAVVRGLAKVKVDDENFPALLDEIDQAVEYFGRECGGKAALQEEMKRRSSADVSGQAAYMSGSIEYYRRALALQEAALFLIKEAVADRVASTTAQIMSTLHLAKDPVPADQLEASLIYTRFHGISSRSHRLVGLLKARLHRGEAYQDLLQQCRNIYCTSRESLLRVSVRAHLDQLKEQHGPVGMMRLACVFLIRLSTVETSLYLDFFGDEKKSADTDGGRKGASSIPLSEDSAFRDTEFQSYLVTLCSAFHRTVRRSLVTMQDLDTLCQIVSALREERNLANASPTTTAAARAISSVIQDAQERLIFCANSTLTKEVIRFKATPSDLDYPDKLQKKKMKTEEEAAAMMQPTALEEDSVDKQLQLVYESWFPPIRGVLRILSKIFRVVEPRVFEDIALQSVQACNKSLRDGAAYIKQRKGVMHSDLFLVKHLLILREQLSPFDIELRSVERQLDFSDAGKAVAKFLANRNRRLFALSTENALLALLREGVSVQESSVDSKRDLEEALRSACHDFIEHTSKSMAGDLLHLVDESRRAGSGSLAWQALLNADSVEIVLQKTLSNVESTLPDVTAQMALYLDNPATLSILVKPVVRKMTRALDEVRKLILHKVMGGNSTASEGAVEGGQEASGGNGWTDERRTAMLQLLHSLEEAIKRGTKMTR